MTFLPYSFVDFRARKLAVGMLFSEIREAVLSCIKWVAAQIISWHFMMWFCL